MKNKIAFQGNFGAYSHKACIEAFPKMEAIPCRNFALAFEMVEKGKAELAMIPIDNSIAGRVADIHHLLPKTKLSIISEHFIPIHHCLLAIHGTKLSDIKTVYSHIHALPQCRKFIADNKLNPIAFEDTAGSAKKILELNDKKTAAIASSTAAELYGLKIIKHKIEDVSNNTTRFIVFKKSSGKISYKKSEEYISSILFKTRNIPAALYKTMGGFATNGINILKIESYLEGNKFNSASFYCEAEGHPDNSLFSNALEELSFFAENIKILGTYKKHSYRNKKHQILVT